MTLLDKAKNFLGGHGVTVRHTAIEERAPGDAKLALSDGGVRGRFVVVAEKPCTVLGRHTQLVMELAHAEGRTETVILGTDEAPATPAVRADATDSADQGDRSTSPAASASSAASAAADAAAPAPAYPYELAAGFPVEDRFDVVFDGSIEAILALRRLTVGGGVRLFLRTRVDVQGSPFDPEAIDEVALVT